MFESSYKIYINSLVAWQKLMFWKNYRWQHCISSLNLHPIFKSTLLDLKLYEYRHSLKRKLNSVHTYFLCKYWRNIKDKKLDLCIFKDLVWNWYLLTSNIVLKFFVYNWVFTVGRLPESLIYPKVKTMKNKWLKMFM